MAKVKKSNTVAEQRNYRVLDVQAAKKVALLWLQQAQLQKAVSFGLPEVDDRYHVWRVPLLAQATQNRIGEVVIDAYTSLILADKSTAPAVLEARLLGRDETPARKSVPRTNGKYSLSSLRNTIARGDCAEILQELPAGSVDLIFTSPPYYNARPEYTDFVTYEEVYRKHTDKLIDWNIRAHPKPELVEASRIGDDYERTNVWQIKPAHDKRHPAIFPLELAEKIIAYYSFKEDVVLDPFAGIGTVGKAAVKLGRRFVLIEQEAKYVDIIRNEAVTWLGKDAKNILTINCPSISGNLCNLWQKASNQVISD
jgi:16S rRNA G966 N2-methylase RsmD